MVLPDFFENIAKGVPYPEELTNYIAIQKKFNVINFLIAIEDLSISSKNKQYLIETYKGVSFKEDIIGFTKKPELDGENIYNNKDIEILIRKILSLLDNTNTIDIYIEFYDEEDNKYEGRGKLSEFLLVD